MKNFKYIIIFTLICVVSAYVSAQQPSKADLEKRKNNLQKEIAETQKQLEQTKQNKNATLSDLKALQSKLYSRTQLINNINTEISGLENNIKTSGEDIKQLNNQLQSQQQSYAASVRYAYKSRESENLVAFLFGAADFNDALRRIQYLKRYNNFRKFEGDKIQKTQSALNLKIGELNHQKDEKKSLLAEEKEQTKELLVEKAETDKVMLALKGKEKELAERIKKDRATAAKLENSIKEMIRKEIALAKKKAEEEARKKAEQEAIAKRKEEEQRKAAELAKANALPGNNVKLRTGSDMRGEGTPATNNTTASTTPTPQKPDAATTNTPKTTVSTMGATTKPSTSPESYKMNLTPEVQNLSNSFNANQGKLPWPVEKGFISSHYGTQKHPLYASVTIDNIGIDITTSAGASARSVFEGTVTKISNIDGFIVMVSHGEYFTIYSGLSSVSVRQGDKISAKQSVGIVGKNEDGVSVLNFQVWKITGNNFATVNPSSWIAR
jgi:septal ring factor EnvC (AmiA/AmiB activator)